MNDSYRALKEELKILHDKKFELNEKKENFKVFGNPNLFLNYIGNPKLFLERKDLKNKIDTESSSLNSVYDSLRKQYRNYFGHLENSALIRKQENLSSRIYDLDLRYRKVESLKKNNFLFKLSSENRRINGVLRKIKHEKIKRKEFLKDTLNEIWDRGICLEVYYTQKGFMKN